MINFSANHLLLLSRMEYRTCAVLLVLVFLTRGAAQRVFRHGNTGIPKAEQSDEILALHRVLEALRRETAGGTDPRLSDCGAAVNLESPNRAEEA
jgi:hypothetical protein